MRYFEGAGMTGLVANKPFYPGKVVGVCMILTAWKEKKAGASPIAPKKRVDPNLTENSSEDEESYKKGGKKHDEEQKDEIEDDQEEEIEADQEEQDSDGR